MARVERVDRALATQLDEIEQGMFALKIDYEKYFSGIERREPIRTREELRRTLRDLLDKPMKSAGQRFRYQQLKARFQSLELYWNRNLTLIERGTHPKMKFRAAVHDHERARIRELEARNGTTPTAPAEDPGLAEEQERVLRERQAQVEREERAYKVVFERYLEARAKCGQSTDLAFDTVREALRKQVRQIKSTYNVELVKFRIVIEEGRAKVKAVPQQPAP